MDELFRSTLIKLALPAMASALLLFATRRRGISWSDDLGLRAPRPAPFALWFGIWIVWILVSEVLIRNFKLEQAQPWPAYPPIIVVMRTLAIGFVGPFTEELLMRGVFLDRLRRTRLGPLGAIVVVALLWSSLHYRYGFATVGLIVVDGLLLGLARQRGGSLWIPIAMHVLGNLISIGQSLALL